MANNEEEQEELWNEPRINAYRYFSSLYAFMAMGMNDAAYGASIPIWTIRETSANVVNFWQALIPYVSFPNSLLNVFVETNENSSSKNITT